MLYVPIPLAHRKLGTIDPCSFCAGSLSHSAAENSPAGRHSSPKSNSLVRLCRSNSFENHRSVARVCSTLLKPSIGHSRIQPGYRNRNRKLRRSQSNRFRPRRKDNPNNHRKFCADSNGICTSNRSHHWRPDNPQWNCTNFLWECIDSCQCMTLHPLCRNRGLPMLPMLLTRPRMMREYSWLKINSQKV